MKEPEIDAMVHAALSSPAGQKFHQWLVNNYLMGVSPTVDPSQALFMNGQQSLVASLNTRFARHIQKQEKLVDLDTNRRNAKARRPRGSV